MTAVQPDVPVGVARAAIRIAGLAVASGGVAAAVAMAYRWYADDSIPEGVAVLAGLTAVALYLNTTAALGQVLGGGRGLLTASAVVANVTTIATATLTALAGRRLGHGIGGQLDAMARTAAVDVDVSGLVRTVGRAVTVTLPDEIEDIDGYDPVAAATKELLAGKTFVLPGRLAGADLRHKLARRLRSEYGVGHVDVDLAADGSVSYLAVGSRAAGIGPTLVPGTAATAIRADPAFSASPGDTVQVWRTYPERERVATGELRGVAGEFVTMALDEPDARAIDPEVAYRLATLPADPRPDREFAALLRRVDETMAAVAVAAGSDLDGQTVGGVAATVVAVRSGDGRLEAIPPRTRTLAADETVYAVARPERLRRLEATAGGATGVAAESEAEPSL